MDNEISSARAEALRKQAWDYFVLHAHQRLTTLNFYLFLASATFAATVATFQKDFQFPVLRLPAGMLLCLLSFAFWKLDIRSRHLIKTAETALRSFELNGQQDDWSGDLSPDCLFSIERREARRREKGGTGPKWPYSYSEVFSLLFSAFFILGFLAILATLVAIVRSIL